MIKKLSLFLLLFSVACKELRKQEEHLPIEKMKAIMLDLTIAESYSGIISDSTHRVGVKNADSLAAFYKAVFAHHNITRESYEQSLTWYKGNPEAMDSIFSALIPVVTALHDSTKKK